MRWILLFLQTFSFCVVGQVSENCDSSYPSKAGEEGIEGFVQMAYDISIKGLPFNITVIKSKPAGVFDEAAVCALSKWKYKPEYIDGIAVEQTGLKVQLDFALKQHGN